MRSAQRVMGRTNSRKLPSLRLPHNPLRAPKSDWVPSIEIQKSFNSQKEFNFKSVYYGWTSFVKLLPSYREQNSKNMDQMGNKIVYFTSCKQYKFLLPY